MEILTPFSWIYSQNPLLLPSSPSFRLYLSPRLLPLSSRYFWNILLLKVVNNIAQYVVSPLNTSPPTYKKMRNSFSIRALWRPGTLNSWWCYSQYIFENLRWGDFSARLQNESLPFNLTLRFWVLRFPSLGTSLGPWKVSDQGLCLCYFFTLTWGGKYRTLFSWTLGLTVSP